VRLRPKHYDYVFGVSQYKFFGYHVGALYGRYELLDQLRAYKVRPAEVVPPHKFEIGTKCHEGPAGTTAAITTWLTWGPSLARPLPNSTLLV